VRNNGTQYFSTGIAKSGGGQKGTAHPTKKIQILADFSPVGFMPLSPGLHTELKSLQFRLQFRLNY
jgi:hypothetical protein